MIQKIAYFSLLALTLFACSHEPLASEDFAPNLQASGQNYDANNPASVVLNSHATYGALILAQNPDLGATAGIEIIWDGPWMEHPAHGCAHPFKENFEGGYCDNKGTICGIVVTALVQSEIFALEGIQVDPGDNPAVLIRAFAGESDMTLIKDFEDHPNCGTHSYSVLKRL